jgi:beta-barrel assembly-enhancing protease
MRKFFILTFLIVFLSGCATLYNPATGRNELILIDTKDEVALGRDLDKQVKKDFKILKDRLMQERLDIIGQRISAVSDRQDLKYTFGIIKDDEFNAFAIPGGFVYVNSGLINEANDDELAAVLAHEIGHIAARHSVKRLQANMGYQILLNIALGKDKAGAISEVLNITYNIIALGFSRQDEFLADKLSVKYSYAAGFNPYGMITFFRKLENNKKSGTDLVFLSSHPPIKDRIERVEKEITLIRQIE